MTRWLVTPGPATAVARHRLVCFPHAGGGPHFYRSWRALLPPSVGFDIVHYPGRETRLGEPMPTDLAELAGTIAAALAATAEPDVPLVLFGHSMGAFLAWEVTRRLEAGGGPVPARLVVSARPGPARVPVARPAVRTDAEILAQVRRHGGTAQAVLDDPDLWDMMLEILREDYRLVDAYRPDRAARIGVPVSAIGGDRDLEVCAADLRAWESATTGPFDWRMFPGGHFYLVPACRAVVDFLVDKVAPTSSRCRLGPA